jgi:GT2 family glycosyltransferase
MIDSCNIIVIGYGLAKIEKQCLSSILFSTNSPYLLTYYDNYGKKTSLTQVWNRVIELSPCNYICLLNSDTVVHPNWLKRMMAVLKKDKQIGFVGPSTNCCHSPQSTITTLEEAEKYKDITEVMKDPISGFCLVFSKDLWKKIGKFDENYDFYGAESDFIDKGMKLGYSAVWVKSSFVYHMGSASIKAHNKDENKERQRARDLYWSTRKHV